DYLSWLKSSPLKALDHGKHRIDSVPVLLERSVGEVSPTAAKALRTIGHLAYAPFLPEPVSATLELPPTETKRYLGELVKFGLLTKKETESFYLPSHALVHTFSGTPRDPDITRHLATYFDNFVRKHRENGSEGFARLNPSRPHLMRVLSTCMNLSLWSEAKDLVWAMSNYLDLSGYRSDQITALESALTAARKLKNKRDVGAFLGLLGSSYYHLSELNKAIDYYEQALTISREIGDRRGEGNQLGNLGLVYSGLGQVEKSIEYYEQALT
ncbi:MAG: tetratricopeptide repeat protein, partial [Deltaproteobacteria bacterium]|nr:tetratricopeptide repeat protein [Deltaproteobacteria bacterium]